MHVPKSDRTLTTDGLCVLARNAVASFDREQLKGNLFESWKSRNEAGLLFQTCRDNRQQKTSEEYSKRCDVENTQRNIIFRIAPFQHRLLKCRHNLLWTLANMRDPPKCSAQAATVPAFMLVVQVK